VGHLSEGTMRRMLDDPDTITSADRSHFAECTQCQGLRSRIDWDAKSVALLMERPEPAVDVAAALARVQQATSARRRFDFRIPLLRPVTRPALAVAAAAVLVLAVVVTGVAQQALLIFQPSQVTPVPFVLADFQSLPDLSAYGDVTWSAKPQPQVVLTEPDAYRVTGLNVPTVNPLPQGVSSTVTYAAMPLAVGTFKFSAAKAAAAAAAQGKSLPPMPAGMDGSTLTITVGPAVVAVYGNLPSPSNSSSPSGESLPVVDLPELVIATSKVPVVTSSQVTVKQLEDYLLVQPGLSPQLAADIRAIGDPTTTLPIPVPMKFATSSKVTVHNVQGVALGDNTGIGSAVVWVTGGQVFVVAGSLKQTEIIATANALH
jgi:hypothetical protein